jgi:hypothetical protein
VVIVLWGFQSKETVVEAFDMIMEENNVLLIVDIMIILKSLMRPGVLESSTRDSK